MEAIKGYADIVPDTSRYENPINKGMARAKVAEAQERGEPIQMAPLGGDFGPPSVVPYEFNGHASSEYRVKPEPVVTRKTEWKLYVPQPNGDSAFDHPANRAGTFNSRAEALRAAGPFDGFVLIVDEYVTYHDGVEVYREASR